MDEKKTSILPTTANAFTTSFMVEPISCNIKKCTCGCDEFCQSTDPPLLRTVLEKDLQLQEESC